jgi:hypothetical protein
MPKVALTPTETRDLVSYLSRLGIDPNAKTWLAITAEVGPGIPFAEVAKPKTGTWPTYHGNLSGNRFSSLTQINAGNIQLLAPKCLFAIPAALRALEVTPLVPLQN